MGWALIDAKGKFIGKLNPRYGRWKIEHVNSKRDDSGTVKKVSKTYESHLCNKTVWDGFGDQTTIIKEEIMCSQALN